MNWVIVSACDSQRDRMIRFRHFCLRAVVALHAVWALPSTLVK